MIRKQNLQVMRAEGSGKMSFQRSLEIDARFHATIPVGATPTQRETTSFLRDLLHILFVGKGCHVWTLTATSS